MAGIETLLKKAQLLLEQGRVQDAEKQLSEVLHQDPLNDAAIALLARCKYQFKKFGEGVSFSKQAISLAPNEDYYHYLLAFGYYQQDFHKEALKELTHAIEINPHAPDYFGLYALVLIDGKKFPEGLAKADEGLAVDPENITCLNARSTALNKLRRTDAAIETMQNALEQDPENDFTHTTIGWNLLEKGRYKEAGNHFREALRINPNLDGGRVGLKESLKSSIPPYRWLLQYSFWINNRRKIARWVLPVSIFIVVRFASAATINANATWKIGAMVLIVLYVVFVATSWVINPLANFFLLFHKDGKYALSFNERWNALFFISSLLLGIFILLVSLVPGIDSRNKTLQFAGIIIASLCVPLGHMQFPWKWKENRLAQWMAMALVVFGTGIATLLVLRVEAVTIFLIIYLLGFIVYSWVQAMASR